MRYFTLVTLLLLIFTFVSFGQIPHGMTEANNVNWGGTNYVVGTVFWPNGQPVNVRMPIKLRSDLRGDYTASTTDSGQFIFGGLPAGRYQVVIDSEKEFQPVAQPVEVLTDKTSIKEVYTVTIRLVEKPNLGTKPGVVKAPSIPIPTSSQKAAALHKEANTLAASGDHKAAIEKLKLAVTESPQSVAALNELGSEYMITGELDKAEEPLRKALGIDAEAFEPTVNLGILQFRLKKYTEAESLLSRAVAAKADSAVAHFYLGRTFYALQKADEAIKELNLTVAGGNESFKEAHRLLAVLYLDKGERSKVVEHLETYLQLVPNAKDADELRLIIKQNKEPR